MKATGKRGFLPVFLTTASPALRTQPGAQWCVFSCSVIFDSLDPFAPLWTVSLSGFSAHGIFQARILERVAIFLLWGESSWPKDWTWISCVFCNAGRFFIHWASHWGMLGHTWCSLNICWWNLWISNTSLSKTSEKKVCLGKPERLWYGLWRRDIGRSGKASW